MSNNDDSDRKLVVDKRFAAVHSDPRFMRRHKNKSKVTVDKRFSKMLTDKRFNDLSAPVDIRGGLTAEPSSKETLSRFYKIESDDEADSKASQKSNEKPENEALEEAEQKLDQLNRFARGEAQLSSSSDDDDSEDDDTSSVEGGLAAGTRRKDNFIEVTEASKRLAVTSLDWESVKAADLLTVVNSFCPAGGVVQKVCIHPSEFGLKRMEEERMYGPTGIWRDEDENDIATKRRNADASALQDVDLQAAVEEVEEGDEGFDQERLRKYELDKLNYYFAVVHCDSAATADVIFSQCDGMEFENSGNALDLRFIPDEVEITTEATDVATDIPLDYKPSDFYTRALNSSKVASTWDQPDPDRVKKMNWERSIAEDAEDSFKAYLASSGSDSDSDDDDSAKAKKRKAIRQRYAALLGSDNEEEDEDEEEKVESEGDDLAEHSDEEAPVKSKSKKSKGGRVKVHDDGMEITFTPGLESKLTKQLEESKKRTSESVWEQYLRKRKEKKRERKLAAKQASAARQAGDAAGEPVRKPTISGKKAGKGSKFSDPLFAMVDDAGSDGGMESAAVPAGGKQLKSERISKREEKERQAAELELLMGNADDQPEGFDMKEVWKAARKAERAAVRKAKKGKKGAKVEMEADDAGFKINTKDSRFARLHTDASFSIDPTDPSFKQTPAMKALLDERQRSRQAQQRQEQSSVKQRRAAQQQMQQSGDAGAGSAAPSAVKSGPNLQQLANAAKTKFSATKLQSKTAKRKQDSQEAGSEVAAPTAKRSKRQSRKADKQK